MLIGDTPALTLAVTLLVAVMIQLTQYGAKLSTTSAVLPFGVTATATASACALCGSAIAGWATAFWPSMSIGVTWPPPTTYARSPFGVNAASIAPSAIGIAGPATPVLYSGVTAPASTTSALSTLSVAGRPALASAVPPAEHSNSRPATVAQLRRSMGPPRSVSTANSVH